MNANIITTTTPQPPVLQPAAWVTPPPVVERRVFVNMSVEEAEQLWMLAMNIGGGSYTSYLDKSSPSTPLFIKSTEGLVRVCAASSAELSGRPVSTKDIRVVMSRFITCLTKALDIKGGA